MRSLEKRKPPTVIGEANAKKGNPKDISGGEITVNEGRKKGGFLFTRTILSFHLEPRRKRRGEGGGRHQRDIHPTSSKPLL